jgi:hypothetical protein
MNWQKYHPPAEAADILTHCKGLAIAGTTNELVDLACGGPQSDSFEVAYDVPGKGRWVEATVARVRNGVAANYTEPYMRRRDGLHELFSYNLYPGPSAKKGIYGVLLGLREREGWVTNHCSTVQVITPYDNVVTIMHEGASGGGKSEMLEQAHREPDGRLLLGENLVTGEKRYLEIPRSCELHAVTDDMALCHPSLQEGKGKLTLTDAENAWFVRVNHLEHYGTDVHLEKLAAEPPVPLLFLSIDAVPGSRALAWEHIEDAPGKRCPNPRLIIPRKAFPGAVEGAVTRWTFAVSACARPPARKRSPLTGSWASFTFCRRRWRGCGDWFHRAATPTRASWTPRA